MQQKKYEDLSKKIVELVGGKENVQFFTHCVTRLRFIVKDKSLVKEDELKQLKGAMGAQWSGEQLQVIIGTDVADVYDTINSLYNLSGQAVSEEDTAQGKKKFSLSSFFEVLSGCLVPVLPILIGSGMIKVLLILLTMGNILTAESSTYTVLSFVADAGFYFLPIFVGATSARKLNTNMALGMAVGAMFLHPTFTSFVNEGVSLSLFGLPITNASYASTVFPTILSVWAMSYVEKAVTKYSPKALRSLLVPLLTLLIMAPIALCVLGPLGSLLGNYLAIAVEWLYEKAGFVGVAVLSAIFPFVVMTGMHHAFAPYVISSLTAMQYEPIVGFANYVSNFCLGAACLAVALKTKDTDKKANSISCATTAALGGISEPGLYGVILQSKAAMISMILGSAVGGTIAGLLRVYLYQFSGNASVFGLAAFIGPNSSNLLFAVGSMLIGVIVTFLTAMVLLKKEVSEDTERTTNSEDILPAADTDIVAIADGEMIDITTVSDAMFAQKMMGDGVAFQYKEDRVTLCSPANGTLSVLFPTGHAYGITMNNGVELLVHCGINTVEANGDGFKTLKKQGDIVKAGEAVIEVDLKKLSLNYDMTTMLIATNSNGKTITFKKPGYVHKGDSVIK